MTTTARPTAPIPDTRSRRFHRWSSRSVGSSWGRCEPLAGSSASRSRQSAASSAQATTHWSRLRVRPFAAVDDHDRTGDGPPRSASSRRRPGVLGLTTGGDARLGIASPAPVLLGTGGAAGGPGPVRIARFAGDGTPCLTQRCGAGGPATRAQLRDPTGVATDGQASVYIADALNSVVWKVSPAGCRRGGSSGGSPGRQRLHRRLYGRRRSPGCAGRDDHPIRRRRPTMRAVRRLRRWWPGDAGEAEQSGRSGDRPRRRPADRRQQRPRGAPGLPAGRRRSTSLWRLPWMTRAACTSPIPRIARSACSTLRVRRRRVQRGTGRHPRRLGHGKRSAAPGGADPATPAPSAAAGTGTGAGQVSAVARRILRSPSPAGCAMALAKVRA